MAAPAVQSDRREIVKGETFFSVALELQIMLKARFPSLAVSNEDCRDLIRLARTLSPSPILLKKLDDPQTNSSTTLFVGEQIPLKMFSGPSVKAKYIEAIVKGIQANRDPAETAPPESKFAAPEPAPLKKPAVAESAPGKAPQKKTEATHGVTLKAPAAKLRPALSFISSSEVSKIIAKVRETLPHAMQALLHDNKTLKIQIAQESSNNIHAVNPDSRATGLTQMVARTARSFWAKGQHIPEAVIKLANEYSHRGYGPQVSSKYSPAFLHNPVVAIWLQEKYMAHLVNTYRKDAGSLEAARDIALVAYYAGESAMNVYYGHVKDPSKLKVPVDTLNAYREKGQRYADAIKKKTTDTS